MADTMMKFASFETTVEMIYNYLPKSKDQYGTGVQTTVSFAGGYIAGILCAIVNHLPSLFSFGHILTPRRSPIPQT